MSPGVLIPFNWVLLAAIPSGAFEGKTGLPARAVTLDVKPLGSEKVEVRWKFADGEAGATTATTGGVVGDNAVRFKWRDHWCTLTFEPDGRSFTGECNEDIGAQARLPVDFGWTGKRIEAKPAQAAPFDGRSFTMKLVPGWKAGEASEGQFDFSSEDGLLHMSMTVDDVDVPLKDIYDEVITQLRASFQTFKMVEEKDVTVGGVRARRAIFTADQDGTKIKMLTIVFVAKGRMYAVNAGGLPSALDARLKGEIEPMLASIKLK